MVKFAMNIAPLTAAERQELGEILAGLGLFRGRRNVTHYSRTTKVGNTTPKGSTTMSPRMKASMLKSMKAAEDRIYAEHAAKAASAFNITLNHYGGDPVVINPATYGLTLQEADAVRKPVAAKAVEEYAISSRELRHGGVDLAAYMHGAYVDEQAGKVPEVLRSACVKLQRHFGAVVDMAGGGLTYA